MKELYAAFPTPIAVYSIDKILTEEVFYVNALSRVANMGNLISSDQYIFKHPKLKRIADFAEQCLNSFLHKVYCPSTDVFIYVTQSWANYTVKGQNHHQHKHPNSFLSGVFYLSVKPEDAIIFIRDPQPSIQIATSASNDWTCHSKAIKVSPGDLIVFPSSLTHMVDTVRTDGMRISIAFNSFLRGVVGDSAQSTELLL